MPLRERTIEDLLARAGSGDLVLFSGKGLVSGAIRVFTRSRWSHVGMVVRDPVSGEALLLESTVTEESSDTLLGRPVRGVQVVRLAEKLAVYDGDVVLRRLELETWPAGFEEQLQDIVELWRYRGYKSFTATLVLDLFSANRRPQRVHRVFCSELVAEIYKRMGVMCRSVRSSRCVPGDFGLDAMPSLVGGRLSAPIVLK